MSEIEVEVESFLFIRISIYFPVCGASVCSWAVYVKRVRTLRTGIFVVRGVSAYCVKEKRAVSVMLTALSMFTA